MIGLSAKIRKIAIFRALQLGDMLCAVPALRALSKAYPDAEVTLLGLPWAKSFVTRFPEYLHSFIHFPGFPGLPEQPFNAADFTQFLLKVQQEHFDLAIQMQGNGTLVNPMMELLGAKYVAGFSTEGHYSPAGGLFLPYPEGIHETERHLRLMEHLGIPSDGTRLEFPLYQKDQDDYDQLQPGLLPGKYICVHPGSRGSWRQWPPVCFANLADYCAKQNFTVVLTGTEEEMDIVRQVKHEMETVPLVLASRTSLGAVGMLLKNARLLISNCTGVAHIAAAMETPSLIISMDGEPERWGPQNRLLHTVIDWTRTPDFELVSSRLQRMLEMPVARNEIRNGISTSI